MLAIVLIYGLRKYEILQERGDTNYNQYVETGVIDVSQTFDFEKTGFVIAFRAVSSLNWVNAIPSEYIDNCNETDLNLYFPTTRQDNNYHRMKKLLNSYLCFDNPD